MKKGGVLPPFSLLNVVCGYFKRLMLRGLSPLQRLLRADMEHSVDFVFHSQFLLFNRLRPLILMMEICVIQFFFQFRMPFV